MHRISMEYFQRHVFYLLCALSASRCNGCSVYVNRPYMVYILDIISTTKVTSGTMEEFVTLSAGALISTDWVITSFDVTPGSLERMVIQYNRNSNHDIGSPRRGIDKFVNSPGNYLYLLKVSRPFALDNSSYPRAINLPPSRDFTKQCKNPNLSGWTRVYNSDMLCYNGGTDKKDDCQAKIQFVNTNDKIEFCFVGEDSDHVIKLRGNVLTCDDDILIGIITESGEAAAIGQFTTWIAQETGLEVPYKAEPVPRKDKNKDIDERTSSGADTIKFTVFLSLFYVIVQCY